MDNKQLISKIAQLETINDHLVTELTTVDTLMRLVGFSNGLATLKATANELLSNLDETEEPMEIQESDTHGEDEQVA